MIRFHGQPFRRKVRGTLGLNYYVRAYDPKTKRCFRVSTGCSTKTAAKTRLDKWRMEAAAGTLDLGGSPSKGRTLKDVAERWKAFLAPRLAKETRDDVEVNVRRWAHVLGRLAITDVTREIVQRYLHDRLIGKHSKHPLQARTVNHERTMLRWFFGWCVKEGILHQNPTAGTERYRQPDRAVRILTAEEKEQLLDSADEVIRPLIGFALETGLRKRTLLRLQWRHVDLDHGWIECEAEIMKSKRGFRSPLSKEAMRYLAELRSKVARIHPLGRVFSVSETQSHMRFHRALKKAGIREFRFHDLRKTFQNDRIRQGVSLEVVMALMDHRDIGTALREYRHIQREELMKAVGREPGGFNDGDSKRGAVAGGA